MNVPAKRLRCAIYTRKSSEEGLEQSFNSLDAQREACASFIQSQRHEGWRALDTRYDDGGYSGGSMERPALKALLTDIDAGKVDAVVVYKVDRLTRSLTDFSRIVERFDARGVSFVSVTQQFNTASSMGRLTLNVLLSFAQFEREVTGERIRDKIAASKKKGLWMGGPVPLGYDRKDRNLVVNEGESEVVGRIYSRYLALGCVSKLAAELRAEGVLSKRRVSRIGGRSGGVPYSRGALYSILKSRLYLGQIEHRGAIYPGAHRAIVDENLWARVQARLRSNANAKLMGARARHPSLLAGVLFDDRENRLTPSHATKDGKRYRYYFSQATIRPGANAGGVRRLPALELEGLVIRRLAAFLGSGKEVLDAAGATEDTAPARKSLIAHARSLAADLGSKPDSEKRALLLSFLLGVTVAEDHIAIQISKPALRGRLVLGEIKPHRLVVPPMKPNAAADAEDVLMLRIEAHLLRCGLDMRLVVPPDEEGNGTSRVDQVLLRAVARSYVGLQKLLSGEADSLGAVAAEYGIHPRYARTMIRCAFLAPDLVEAILDGRQPPQLNMEKLRSGVPLAWDEQRRMLGISAR